MRLLILIAAAVLSVTSLAGAQSGPSPAATNQDEALDAEALPAAVNLTWLSVTNWLLEAGEARIALDAGFSRIDQSVLEDLS